MNTVLFLQTPFRKAKGLADISSAAFATMLCIILPNRSAGPRISTAKKQMPTLCRSKSSVLLRKAAST